MSPFLLTHFKVLVSYVYPVEHTSGLIPKLETNSNIFLLSTCWNAFKAGMLRDVDNARRNVIVPKNLPSQLLIFLPSE